MAEVISLMVYVSARACRGGSAEAWFQLDEAEQAQGQGGCGDIMKARSRFSGS